jgi:hypothetical protein
VIDRVAGDTVSIAGLLEETVIAPVSEEGVSAGDLLVLSRSPAMVLVYHLNGPHGVADILADDCVNCGTDVEPDVVISGSVQVDMPGTSPDVPFSSFDPTGMDFYGDDLLIATGRGEIVRIDLDLLANPVPGFSAATIFRQGLGNGKSRIKTGFQGGSAAVFVTNQNRGSLMRFRNEGAIVDEVTGLQNPEGLAVSIAAFEPVANCIVGSVTNPGTGCDPSVNDDTFPVGGVSRVFEQQISSLTGAAPGSGVSVAPNSNVLQDFCVASANAVSAVLDDLVPGESPTIEKFCPGWGAEVNPVIPPELVHEGFPLVFVKTTAPGLVITHGLVQTESDEANLIPGFVDSQQCPYYRTAWAPSDVGDNAVAEDGDGNPVFEENLTGCGSLLRLGRGGSFHMIGPFTLTDEFNDETVNLDDLLRTFVLAKFDRLELVMAATHSSPGRLMSQIDKCVATARRTYERANNAQKLSSALADLAKCDTLVTGTTAGQLTSTAYRNPGGDMLWRIRNIAFTIREHAGL